MLDRRTAAAKSSGTQRNIDQVLLIAHPRDDPLLWGRKMIDGRFNDKLFPIASIDVMTEDGESKSLNLLIDTGFEGYLELNEELVAKHNLWWHFVNDGSSSFARMLTFRGVEASPRRMVKLRWGHGVRQVPALLNLGNPFRDFHGLIGMHFLTGCRADFDVIEDGAFSIDRIPPVPWYQKVWHSLRRDEPNYPCMGALNWECADDLRTLPWDKIQVRDSRGTWQLIKVNIDTGFNGELAIPTDLRDKLGLTRSTGYGLSASSGSVREGLGQVDICWQGQLHHVECDERPASGPALIGTKLLPGNRLVVDSPYGETIATVTSITESFLDSLLRRAFGRGGAR